MVKAGVVAEVVREDQHEVRLAFARRCGGWRAGHRRGDEEGDEGGAVHAAGAVDCSLRRGLGLRLFAAGQFAQSFTQGLQFVRVLGGEVAALGDIPGEVVSGVSP